MKIPQHQDLLRAERQVLTGVYVRLLRRYVRRFPAEEARALSAAMTKRILGVEPDDTTMDGFVRFHDEDIDREIDLLRDDHDIRRIVTDMVVIKVVFAKRHRGCSDEDAAAPVDHLKETGLFLEGDRAPTPAGFLEAARAFYDTTPW